MQLFIIDRNEGNYLTVCKKKMSLGLFKNVIYRMYLKIIDLIYMYKNDLALNNLQWLICHKTKPNQTIFITSVPQAERTYT